MDGGVLACVPQVPFVRQACVEDQDFVAERIQAIEKQGGENGASIHAIAQRVSHIEVRQ